MGAVAQSAHEGFLRAQGFTNLVTVPLDRITAARPAARLLRSRIVPAPALLARAVAVPSTAAFPVMSVGPSPLAAFSSW